MAQRLSLAARRAPVRAIRPVPKRRAPQAVRVRSLTPKRQEDLFQSHVRGLAQLYGWGPDYHTYDSRRSPPGFPDLVLVRPPRVIFAELKVGRGVLTPYQRVWRDALLRCPGVEYFCWYPRDLLEIERVLRRAA